MPATTQQCRKVLVAVSLHAFVKELEGRIKSTGFICAKSHKALNIIEIDSNVTRTVISLIDVIAIGRTSNMNEPDGNHPDIHFCILLLCSRFHFRCSHEALCILKCNKTSSRDSNK